ncbi:MAG TPA: hypothetical protein VJB57_11965 [Dehalococcoidia bacterium]|nr:hypothetical protein [Dehalococcoidia bacterium]
MNPACPLTGNPIVLQRLARFYLVVFWAIAGLFYLSVVQAEYNPALAMLSFTSAGLACLLLSMKQRAEVAVSSLLTDDAWHQTETGRTLVAEAQLLLHLHDLFHDAADATGEVGLTLVTLRGPVATDSHATEVVRNTLFRETDSRIFEMDGNTFAFAERRPNVSVQLEALAAKLESEMQALRGMSPKHADYGITVGMTVASTPGCSTTDLLVNARASRKFAEARGRDRFICKV